MDYATMIYTFDSYYGNQGMGLFVFSDILGDHRINAGIELGDISKFKDTDYYLMYSYLKNQLNKANIY